MRRFIAILTFVSLKKSYLKMSHELNKSISEIIVTFSAISYTDEVHIVVCCVKKKNGDLSGFQSYRWEVTVYEQIVQLKRRRHGCPSESKTIPLIAPETSPGTNYISL